MNKYSKILLLCLVFTFSFAVPAASASDLMDNLMPDAAKDPISKYSIWNYSLETYLEDSGFTDWLPWNWEDTVSNNFFGIMGMFLQGLWLANAVYCNFAISWIGQAFNLDLISALIEQVDQVIKTMSGINASGFTTKGLWVWLGPLMLFIVGIWAVFQVGKGKTTSLVSNLLATLIAMTISAGFIMNAGTILGGINEDIKGVQNGLLSLSTGLVAPGATYTDNEGQIAIRKQMFNLMVHQPYLLLQYGTTDETKIEAKDNKDGSRINRMLKEKPFSKNKNEEIENEGKEIKNETMLPQELMLRVLVMGLIFIANTILASLLLLLALSSIWFQFGFIFIAMLGPAILIFALLPNYQKTVWKWAEKLIYYQVMKIGITLLLILLFTLSAVLFAATEKFGYAYTIIIQIVMYVGVWWNRKKLFSVVVSKVKKSATNVTLGQNFNTYKRHITQIKNKVIKRKAA